MLKPERVTFSADDDKFHQFANSDQLDTFFNDSLVHYSTDFKSTNQQEITAIKHSTSLNELSSITMSSQQQQQQQQQQQEQQQTEHEPPASAPPTLISEQVPTLTENNLHQLDALTLQQLAIGSNQTLSNINEANPQISPTHSTTSYADIQKEIDRVRQLKYGRTYSSPTSSLCSRISINPFNGSNSNIDISSITHPVHFTEQLNEINRLPFSSTYITSIPESIVPASGTSSTNDNHFIPIHHIESPTLEDREVFETFHTKQSSVPGIAIRQSVNSLNRDISTSETDLIASLHRSASKQALDNQSEHGTTYSGTSDDMIFIEWDKERNLFQDYINSLRTEIRVLLQERSEYQKQMETINNNLTQHKRLGLTQINTDQNKLDLLQKSLEEKNLVLEQLQKEYETMKEKNINLTRKISNLRCDAKSQNGVIDELKQKIAELTVDIQNHILIKRRLEISLMNLENDCKIIDAERLRLNNDVKDIQLNKQDLEKLLQQANVQIAEQGSTIEKLRSDNIQIRSQLSATQRRMLQEKQQVMDYLRQIENDLIEKEQLKQRESILRKDFEKLQIIHKQDREEIDQFNKQIYQDQQKLNQLEQERLQLLKTIQNMDDKQIQLESDLDSYKTATKRLYTHFKIPFDSIQSIDQIIPMLENRYRTEQVSQVHVHQIPLLQSASEGNNEQDTEEIRRLREDLISMNVQLKQLDAANQGWQQYQQNQLILLSDRLKLTDIDNLPFEDIVQQIEKRFDDLNNQLMELKDRLEQQTNEIPSDNTQLMSENIRQSKDTQTEHVEEEKSQEIPIKNVIFDVKQYEEELYHLREDLAALTTQCGELDEANRAWQQYHQTQLDSFKDKLQNNLPIDNSLSFEDIVQQIVAHLNQQQNEYQNLMQQLQTSEKLYHDLRSTSNNQPTQQTYDDTINDLNQQLRLLKQQNDQLETEKYILNQQLENQSSINLNQQLENQSSINLNQERNTPTPDSISADSKVVKKHLQTTQAHEAPIHNVSPVQSASPLINEHEQELQQLRQNVTLLTNQCAQLDQANRAWQQYQQTQLDNFRNIIQTYIPTDENLTLEQVAQQILDQINKERENFTQQYHALEKVNDDLRAESAIDLERINELNQQLLAIKEKNQQTNDLASSNLLTQTFEEIPIASSLSTTDEEEIRELRENLASLTAQLDETNRVWQQYQQTQLHTLRNQLHNCLSIEDTNSFDDIAQQIVDQITKEREEFYDKYQALERVNNDLQSESSKNLESIRESFTKTVNELNQELLAMKEAYDRLDAEKQDLVDELGKRVVAIAQEPITEPIEKVSPNRLQKAFDEVPIHTSNVTVQHETEKIRQLEENVVALTTQCAQLDEANRAWQQYQETQLNSFQTKLHDYFPIDESTSFDEIAQLIVDQVTKEREEFNDKYQALERVNNDLQSDSATDLETIKQTYMNTVNDLDQQLLTMREAYEKVNAEKQDLIGELEKRAATVTQAPVTETIEKISPNRLQQAFKEVPIHTSSANVHQEAEKIRQLEENVVALTTQCAQLDEANRAWQQYQQNQLDSLRTKLHDCFSIDESTSVDEIAQLITDQIAQEREDFNKKYQALEKVNNDLRSASDDNMESIRQSHANTLNELNQQLLAMKEAYEKVDAEKQDLINELEKRPVKIDQEPLRQTIEKVPSDFFKQPFKEVPIHSSSISGEQDAEELRQLRENVALLTNQCAQLDEANRAWQLYQQTQSNAFRTKLIDYVPIEENTSFDQMAQEIVDYILKEREEFNERFQTIEKANNDFLSESTSNLESIRDSYTNAVNELNQELLAMKEAYEKLDAEKQNLINELEKRPIAIAQETVSEIIEKISPNGLQQAFDEVPIDAVGGDVEPNAEELQQLRENVLSLTAQCAQLDEANRAWQQYQQTQLDSFRTKLHDYFPIDENVSLNDVAQQIVDQITKEREDFSEKYAESEKINDDLRSESATDLETIKQSYANSIDQLSKELLSMKEQCEQLNAENQLLSSQVENQSLNANQEEDQQIKDSSSINLTHEIPLHTSAFNVEQENVELQQLRENLTALTTQYTQLNDANRAWQDFHQSQLDNFRTKVQDYIDLDDDISFDQIAQQIVDQITKEREDFTERYHILEKANNDLQIESMEENKNSLLLKQQYEELLHEKEMLINQIENQERNRQTIESTNSNLLEQETEMFHLRDNLLSLTTQLNETNRSWKDFEHTQSNLLKTLLPFSNKTSLEELIQDIILHINHLTNENNLLKENEQQNISEKNHYDKIEQDFVLLQNQCTQLDIANQAWQTFYNNQINLLKDKFKNFIQFDDNLDFEQIIQLIATELEKEPIQNTSQENEQLLNQQILTLQNECQNLEQQLKDSQYSLDVLKNNLVFISNENEQLKQQFNELQEKNHLLMNNNQNLTNQLERQSSSSPLRYQETFKQYRRTPIQDVQIHRVTPIQSASTPTVEDEVQQLRTNVSNLTAQCAQLDEANRAWQQYHQNQLEIFRNKLQDWILLDENSTLEQIAQQIVIRLDQLINNQSNDNQLDSSSTIESLNQQLVNYQLNESVLAQNLEQLNQKLLDVYQECEEFREHNAQLILSKQSIEQQLEERQQLLNDLQSKIANSEQLAQLQQYNDALHLDNQQLQLKLNDAEQRLSRLAIQRVDSPRENVAIHNVDHEDEIRQLRTDLATLSAHCSQLEEANRVWEKYQHDQIESFKQKLREQIPAFNQIQDLSLDSIAQQIISYLDQLIRHNDLLKDEIRVQKQQLDRPGSADSAKRIFRRQSQDKHIRETPIHNVSPVQSASPLINEHEQELQQLRQNVTLLTNQCAQLDQANRAWQQYQQTQLHHFRNIIQTYIPTDVNLTLEQVAQQILDQINKERENFTQQYHALEKVNDDLRAESAIDLERINELNQQLLAIKEKNQQTNDLASSNLLTQTFEEIPIASSLSTTDEEEIRELRENLASLTAQLDETNRVWQQYQQTQLHTLRNQLHNCLSIEDTNSFDDIAQQIVDQITKEREEFYDKYQALERVNNDLQSESSKNLESIRESFTKTVNELNQELLAMKEAYDRLDAEKQDLVDELGKRVVAIAQAPVTEPIEKVSPNRLQKAFDEVPIHTSNVTVQHETEKIRQLEENVIALTTQCAQLDEANRAWQQYQETQLNSFQTKLHDYFPIDESTSFDEIAQLIVDQVTKEREEFNDKYQALERVNNDLQSESSKNLESIQESYTNAVNELNQELLAMREAYDQLDAEKQDLVDEIEKRSAPVDQAPITETIENVSSTRLQQAYNEVPNDAVGGDVERNAEELQQLRENVIALTAQCAQLDEANHAWQRYQQTQLDSFRTKLHDYFPIDENVSLDDVIQQIVDQITREREDFSEKCAELEKMNDDLRSASATNLQPIEQSSTENLDELNQELLNLKTQYEELKEVNKQLLMEKEDLNNQLKDQSIVVGQHSASDLNPPVEDETVTESKQESELQSSSIPDETEEIRQIRSDLALISSQFAELTQTNRNELNSFRNKLQNWISLSLDSTLDEIAQQLTNQFEEQQQNIRETTENETQTTELSEKVHVAIETTPLTYENHQTQIDPIDMIDQQIQTESFQQLWSNSDDENLFHSDEDDDRLQEYINEITSLSPLDLSNRLNKDCQQILSKQNFDQNTYPNLDLNHLALITIYSLYNQHLTDDGKQLYNETVIRALKQEYELINNEKNDYIEKYLNETNEKEKKFHQLQNQYDELLEQNELERLHSKQSLNDLIEKYEIKLYNLHQENEKLKYNFNILQENSQKLQEENYQQIQNEYQQLRQDYNDLVNENELLKDYNSQMYQRKLQVNDLNEIELSRNVDIQCNLLEENQVSSWNNNWNEDNTHQDVSIQEQVGNEEEINRLKAIIEKIQIENNNLKESNLQNTNIYLPTQQSILVDSYVQTEIENEQISTDLPKTKDNDWNSQMSPIEIPLDESNVSFVVTKETVHNETQTEEQSQDKLTQVNNKLKRALQTIKDKIHQAVIERSELFPDISDDTIERLDHLISTIESQATQIDILHNERDNLLERNTQLEKNIQSHIDRPISNNDNFTQTDLDEEVQTATVKETEEPSLSNRLFDFISNVTSSSPAVETLENETQTEEQPQDKLAQVNNKLKRALQNIKDKINQAVAEQPELFIDIGDDTIERLDHLISTVGNQATKIDALQNERDYAQHEINELQSSLAARQYQINNERPTKTESLVSAIPLSDEINNQSTIDKYEQQIKQLQQKLSQNEDERSLLRERLNEVELELTKTLDDRSSTLEMYEQQLQSAIQERNAIAEQQAFQLAETQHEIEQLQEELAQLKQTPVTSHVDIPLNEDVKSLQGIIQEQTEELRDVTEKYFALLSQVEQQSEFEKHKQQTNEQLHNYENQIEQLIRDYAVLLEQVEKKSSSPVETTDNESQTDDHQHDKLVQVNNKLKRVLQIFRDKIQRLVTERPDLFVNIGEETTERLDHLIATVEYQATQIDMLQSEHHESEEQLRNEIQELQSSLEACQYQLANERPIKAEQLVSASSLSEDINQSAIDDYEKQIKQLQQKFSQNEDERSLLRERLNEVELELTKTLDDRSSTLEMYEQQLQSAVQERDSLVEQHVLQLTESRHQIEQLQQELDELKQLSVNHTTDLSSKEEIQTLKDIIEEQSNELKDINEKYHVLSTQFDTNVNLQTEFERERKEIEERLADYENQIENLTREREHLLEEIQKNSVASSQATDSEKQVGDQSNDKLTKTNTKLKRALQTIKDKMHRIATERSDLFTNIGEETNERLDHLIATVENQATQLDILQAEHRETEEQLRNEIRELQSSVDAYRYQIENERPIKTESLVSAVPLSDEINSQSTIDKYEQQIKQLQQKLSQNEDERSLLRERLNEVELEFRKSLDDRASTLEMYEQQLQSAVQERNAIAEQYALQSTENQHEIEQLQNELAQLKQSSQGMKSLNEIIEQQSEELKHLNEKYIIVSSQLESQAYLEQQKKEIEERLVNYKNQIENLTREREHLLEEIQKNTVASAQATDSEKQAKLNTKLKRALQTIKDKMQRIATERPDLFANIGEETNERLDHLIATVEHQATQLDILQAEHRETEEQLQNQIRELQSSVDAYRYQIENERPIKAESLVSAVPLSDEINNQSTIDKYEQQIKQLQQKLSQNEDERSLLRERLNEVELELTKTLDDRSSTLEMYEQQLQSAIQERNAIAEQYALQSTENQHEIEQLQKELAQLKQSSQGMESLNEIIEQQSEQLKHLNEKYTIVSSQLESQADLERQKKEIEERVVNFENQIDNLTREREHLLEEIQKNAASSVQTTDSEKQIDDQPNDKLAKVNTKLKRALQTIKDKMHRIATERPDLFTNIGEETNERLDHLIATVEHQATQIDILQAEHRETEEQLRNEIRELQSAFDLYHQQIDDRTRLKHVSSPPVMIHKIENEITEHKQESQPLQTASNDNQWNDWSINSPQITDENVQYSANHPEPTVANRLFGFLKNVTSSWAEETPTNDWNDQNSPVQLPSDEPEQALSSPTSNDNLTSMIKNKMNEIISEYPDLFPDVNNDVLNNLDQFNSAIQDLQNQIKVLRNLLTAHDYQKQIEHLIEERDEARQEKETFIANNLAEYQSQIDTLLRERLSLMEEINQLTHRPIQQHMEIQTDNELLTTSEQRISRRIFEQEMLAWTKETDQLKQYVKQIQIENKKLKDIILKLERIINDYMHENERLKQENQQLFLLSYSLNTEHSTSSDTDICYLTLKWLTYEVAQRTSDNNNTTEQSLLINDDNEPYLKQRLIDTERQLKSIRIQNQRLKKQLETYTIQFKHIQHDMNNKIQELSTLKIETDRLRTSETQYRLEVDRLKADIQCDQVKFQQLERELTDLKLVRTNLDDNSTNNLRELLELKERELNALKEKLDYTIQVHQLELQEAIKANQFSLDNVQRFEKLDQRHQEKRRELETRLGKICRIIKPLIDNQYLFNDDSMIDIDELQQLITDTEAEQRVINSLGPIRDCLGLLESQMKELQHNLIENQTRRSKRSKYRSEIENQEEITIEPINDYSYLITRDFIENDVRLCLDDLLDEVIVRTTVK